MEIGSVCILGGTGFVGRAIAEQLASQGMRVRIVTRSEPRATKLRVLPTVEILVANPHRPEELARCFDDMDAAINLVGILHEGRGRTFRECHTELPRKVLLGCHHAGVRHLLHMSALGASESGPSEYQRSKARGEAALREHAGATAVTILRPSVIFGEDDDFLNLFAGLARVFPVIPLAAAGARLQPIWVEDVAACFATALGNSACFGKTYDLCGPKAYTLEELVRFVAATLGLRRRIVRLSGGLATLQAFVLEHLPGKMMTRDNLRSLSVDNVCSAPFAPVFGFLPAPMEAIVPEYLDRSAARARYSQYRHTAGR